MKINKAYKPLYYSKKRYNILKGGAGSGKSFAAHQIKILQSFQQKKRVLWIRKVADTIRGSIFQLVQDILDQENLRKGIDYTVNKTEMSFLFSNGSQFIMKGMDDPEKMKSVAGITDIVIEEGTELDEEDFNQLDLRLRGKTLKDPSITILFNPISANHWLCKRFDVGYDSDTMLFLNTTYKDNDYLDEAYIKMLENLLNIDENLYRIYVLNEWGIEDPEKLFAKDYKPTIHYTKQFDELYDENSDIYLAWDFNIQNTCLIIQTDQEGDIRVLREYHIKGYDLSDLCNLILSEFPGHTYWVNGDASGKAQSALTTGNQTAYDILKYNLELSWEQFHVPNANPSHRNSRLLTNLLFKFGNVQIAKECEQLHNDLISVEIDDKGSMDAYKKKHSERTHHLDPLRYHISAHHYRYMDMLQIKKDVA